MAPLSSPRTLRKVAHYPAKPTAQFGGFMQARQLPPGGDKGFLRQLFALRHVADRAVGQRTDRRLMAGHDPPKGLAVSRQAERDEVGIGWGCGGQGGVWVHVTRVVANSSP